MAVAGAAVALQEAKVAAASRVAVQRAEAAPRVVEVARAVAPKEANRL